MNERKGHNWALICVASLFLTITFCVFGPIQLYITNISEFWFSIKDIWWLCIICGFIMLVFLLGFYFLIPKAVKEYYCCLVFGVALALYLQGNYIPMNFGTLNGESIDWTAYASENIISFLLWFACIGGIIVAKLLGKQNTWKKIIYCASTGILAIQIITLVVLGVTTDFKRTEDNQSIYLSTENEFNLSKENNTIVFVLDCYDSKAFYEFTENHPEYKETLFNDFTYYPNTVGGATRTVLALPYILTSYPYTHGETYSDYIKAGYENTALYQALENKGYSTGLYTEASFVSPEVQSLVSNIEYGKQKIASYPALAKCLLQFTACRYFPQVLKPYVWMYSGDFNQAAESVNTYVINDEAFYEGLVNNELSVNDWPGAFRLYHLNGAHAPYTLDAQAHYQEATSFEEQQMGVMKILDEFFSQMKELGIYENANIVIMSDHGEGGIEYNPMLLIKDSTVGVDRYEVSDIPVSYENFQPTILDWLGSNKTGRKAIKDLEITDNQERFFYRQIADGNNSYAEKYRITGVVPKNENIEQVGRYPIMTAGKQEKIQLNETVYFDATATGIPYIVSGFRATEATHTWTLGEKSELLLPLKKSPNSDLLISIDLASQITPIQRVGIEVNNSFLGWYSVIDRKLEFKVPSQVAKNELSIVLKLPDASSPRELNAAATDNSQLSLAFYSLTIKEWKESSQETAKIDAVIGLRESIDFSETGNCENYIISGWYGQEANHRWSSEKASIGVMWDSTKDYIMQISGWTYPTSGTVDVFFNGTQVATLQGNQFEPIILSSDLADSSGLQTIDFITHNATSPKQAGESEDGRLLGIAINSIEFKKED